MTDNIQLKMSTYAYFEVFSDFVWSKYMNSKIYCYDVIINELYSEMVKSAILCLNASYHDNILLMLYSKLAMLSSSALNRANYTK